MLTLLANLDSIEETFSGTQAYAPVLVCSQGAMLSHDPGLTGFIRYYGYDIQRITAMINTVQECF